MNALVKTPAHSCHPGPEPGRQGRRQGNIVADLWPHPVTAEGRETRALALAAGATVADALALALPVRLEDVAHGIAVALDGRPVAAADWARTPAAGHALVVRAAAGGGDDSDPLRVVLTIGVAAASIAVPGLPALAGTAFATGTLGGAALSAGILVGGSLVVNALAPPPAPPTLAGPEPADEVWSLAAGQNRARAYEPMRLVLGSHRVFPDLCGREYTEFDEAGEQDLFQQFSFGVGDLDIADLRLGETALADYDGVLTETAGPGERLTLVHDDVDTTPGATLEDTEWVVRATPERTARVEIDIAGRVFRIGDRGEQESHAVPVEWGWRRQGSGAWSAYQIEIANDDASPVRRGFSAELPSPGSYEVRVRRAAAPADEERTFDDLAWAALRSYQESDSDRGADTRLGVRIRASGQLHGRLDRLSALVTQNVPAWNAPLGRWSPDTPAGRGPSANPAAVFRAFARGWHDADGRLVAGGGRPAEDLDDETLGAWYVWCERNGLSCRRVLSGGRVEDVEAEIARCGRGAPTWQTGKLGVVWEDPDRPPSALITPARVLAGSVRAAWAAGEAAEEIVVRYIDPADWQRHDVRRVMPGIDTPRYTATLDVPGLADRDQAATFANLQAASQRWHRRRIQWEMGPDGAAVARGDVLWMTHDLISGGTTGRLAGGTAAAPVLDREVDLAGGGWLLFDLPGAGLHTSAAAPGADARTVVLADPLPRAPGSADGEEAADTVWRLYAAGQPPAAVRVVAVEPLAEDRVRLTAIDEVAAYHELATSDLDAPIGGTRPRAAAVLGIAVSERRVRAGAGYAVEIEAALTVTPGWSGGVVTSAPVDAETNAAGAARQAAALADGATVARWLEDDVARTIEITAVPGSRDAPAGRAFRVRHTIRSASLVPPAPTGFAVTEQEDGTRLYDMTLPDIPDLKGAVVRYAADAGVAWTAMTPLSGGAVADPPRASKLPPAGTWTFSARTLVASGALSDEARITATLGEPYVAPRSVLDAVAAAIRDNPAFADLDDAVADARAEADRAAARALESGARATDAAGSATAAAGAATTASEEATAADGSAEAAAASATAAAASATAAGGSATGAATQAQSAQARADAAGASAAAADTSATRAATAAGQAATAVTQAAASRDDADGSAQAAALSATAAAGSAADAAEVEAGLEAAVSREVAEDLNTRLASIVALRAKAGDASGNLELAAYDDGTFSGTAVRIRADQILIGDDVGLGVDAAGNLLNTRPRTWTELWNGDVRITGTTAAIALAGLAGVDSLAFVGANAYASPLPQNAVLSMTAVPVGGIPTSTTPNTKGIALALAASHSKALNIASLSRSGSTLYLKHWRNDNIRLLKVYGIQGAGNINLGGGTTPLPPGLPAASAPTVTIAAVSSVGEGATQTLSASVSGGTYDGLSYAWAVVTASGGTISGSGSSVTYTAPAVTANKTVTVRCTVTASGSGTDARSGTTDTASDTEAFTVTDSTAPPSPPPPTTTTVSANAGADKTVASGGSVGIGGADTVNNGSGATSIAWTRMRGTGGSLSSTTAASPTFNAPTVTADRTIVWRKTVTNNGVSDTDDVTVTVAAPAGPKLDISWTSAWERRVGYTPVLAMNDNSGLIPSNVMDGGSAIARVIRVLLRNSSESLPGRCTINMSPTGTDFISSVENNLQLTVTYEGQSVSISFSDTSEPYTSAQSATVAALADAILADTTPSTVSFRLRGG